MATGFVHQFTHQLTDKDGAKYSIFAFGEPRSDGTWEGWIEFHPLDSTRSKLRTERETTQPDKAAIEYWVTGLEPLYFEGAFARAGIR
jgi:hypothetical protein